MVVTANHVESYLAETSKLYGDTPLAASSYMVGYLRFSGPPSGSAAAEAGLLIGGAIEDTDRGAVGCLGGRPYLAVRRNPHQAMLILTADELRILSKKCNFLNQSLIHISRMHREYISSFSVFEGSNHFMRLMNFPPSCKTTKLVPIESMESFFVRHLKRSSLSLPFSTSMSAAEVSNALRVISIEQEGETKCTSMSQSSSGSSNNWRRGSSYYSKNISDSSSNEDSIKFIRISFVSFVRDKSD